jgi:glycosyltransferase involved in cell wall biosynthesis
LPATHKPIPVLLLARELGPGGSERQLTELAKAIDKREFEVHVGFFRTGPRSEELEQAGVPTFQMNVVSFRRPEALRQAFRLRDYLKTHHIQVVHSFDYPLTCYAVPLSRVFGTPVVLSSQRGSRDLIPLFYRKLVRITDLIADGIVANCRAMETHLVKEEDVPRRRVHLCYNGIDTARYTPAKASERNAPWTIGCVSVLRPEKNLGLLLRAGRRLLRDALDVRVLIVGSGSEERRLRELAYRLRIDAQTVFLPVQQNVISALEEIDIFVLPSITEAFSNSLMEAMACGCPVVASHVGGNSELIDHEHNGLLFESGNLTDLTKQLARLIRDEPLRKRFGEAARESVERQFSIETSARRMEEIYRSLLFRAAA